MSQQPNSPGITVAPSPSHKMAVDRTRAEPPKVLMVVANPAVSSNNHWPVGFWASELTHPYLEFTDRGIEVTIASPDGGRVTFDQLSDPRDQSQWSADDLISMGFIHTPELMEQLETTPKLAQLDHGDYHALVICGGQSPMFTFPDHRHLQRAILNYYDTGRIVAALCHGVSALLNVQLPGGQWLVAGKTVTGFANVEEDYGDAATGVRIMPWRLEDSLRERGANYIQAGLFKPFAIRDGRLVTGQQQYSGREVARLVSEMLAP